MKIGLTGTVSVGKTTLSKTLSKLPEFKNYNLSIERSKYLRDLGIPLNTNSTLKGQIIFLAERCSELIKENLLTDRTIIDVLAFTSLAQSISQPEMHKFENLAKELISEYDYIIYIPPQGVEIENNLIRETDAKYRESVDESILYFLNVYKHRINNIIILPPNLTNNERVDFIIKNIFNKE